MGRLSVSLTALALGATLLLTGCSGGGSSGTGNIAAPKQDESQNVVQNVADTDTEAAHTDTPALESPAVKGAVTDVSQFQNLDAFADIMRPEDMSELSEDTKTALTDLGFDADSTWLLCAVSDNGTLVMREVNGGTTFDVLYDGSQPQAQRITVMLDDGRAGNVATFNEGTGD